MTPKVKAAIHIAKTCAPALCEKEDACFILAQECERLHCELEALKKKLTAGEVSLPAPTWESSQPDWSAS